MTTPKRKRTPKLEDLLAEELRREMSLATGAKIRYMDDWDAVMHSFYELPIEFDGYMKRINEMAFLKEIADRLEGGDYDDVKRSESRSKQMAAFTKTSHMYYNIILSKDATKTGYGALIYFPQLNQTKPERSSGVVLGARCIYSERGASQWSFEKAKFDDFLLEVKPYIDLLGGLYRRGRRP